MSNSGLPVNLPTLAILLLASSNKDVEQILETVCVLAQNTHAAIQKTRQGVQAIQNIVPLINNLGNSPKNSGSAETPALPKEAESGKDSPSLTLIQI